MFYLDQGLAMCLETDTHCGKKIQFGQIHSCMPVNVIAIDVKLPRYFFSDKGPDVDASWGAWGGSWTACSKTCGSAVK